MRRIFLVAAMAVAGLALLAVPHVAAAGTPTVSSRVGSDLWTDDGGADFTVPANGPSVAEASVCRMGTVFPILVRTEATNAVQWFKATPGTTHLLDVERKATAWADQLEVKAEPISGTSKSAAGALSATDTLGLKLSITDRTGGAMQGARVTFFVALDGTVEDNGALAQPYTEPPSASEFIHHLLFNPARPPSIPEQLLRELRSESLATVSTPLIDELGLVKYVPHAVVDTQLPRNYAPAVQVTVADRGYTKIDPTAPHCWAALTFVAPPGGRFPSSMEVVLEHPEDSDTTHTRTHIKVTPHGSPSTLELRAAIYQGTTTVVRDAVPAAFTIHSSSAPPPGPSPAMEKVHTLTWSDDAAQDGFHAIATFTNAPSDPAGGYDLTILATERRQSYDPGIRMQWKGPQVALDLRMDLRKTNEGPATFQIVTPKMPTDMGVCYDQTPDHAFSGLKYDASSSMPYLFFRHTEREASSGAFSYVDATLTDFPSHLMFLKSTKASTSPSPTAGQATVTDTNETAFTVKTKFSVPCLSDVGAGTGWQRMGIDLDALDVDAHSLSKNTIANVPLTGAYGGVPDGAFFRLTSQRQDVGGAPHAREMRSARIDYRAPATTREVRLNITEAHWDQVDRYSTFLVQNLPGDVHLAVVNRTESPGTQTQVRDLGVDLRTNGTSMALTAEARELHGGAWTRSIGMVSDRIPEDLLLNVTSRPSHEPLRAGNETRVAFDAATRTDHMDILLRSLSPTKILDTKKVHIDGLPTTFRLRANERLVNYTSPEGIDDLTFLETSGGATVVGWPLAVGHVRVAPGAVGVHIQSLKGFEYHNAPHPKAIDPLNSTYVNGTFTKQVALNVVLSDGSTVIDVPALADRINFASDFKSFLEWRASSSIEKLTISLKAATTKYVKGSATTKALWGTDHDTFWRNDTAVTFLIEGLPTRIDVDTNFRDVIDYDAERTTRFVSLSFGVYEQYYVADGAYWSSLLVHKQVAGHVLLGDEKDAKSVAVPKHFHFVEGRSAAGGYQRFDYTANGQVTKSEFALDQTVRFPGRIDDVTALVFKTDAIPVELHAWFTTNPVAIQVTSPGIDSVDVWVSNHGAKSPRAAPPQTVKNYVDFETTFHDFDLWGHVDGLKALVFQLNGRGVYSSYVDSDGAGGGILAEAALRDEIPFHLFMKTHENGNVPEPSASVKIDVTIGKIRLGSVPSWCAGQVEAYASCMALHFDTNVEGGYAVQGHLDNVVFDGCVQAVYLDADFRCNGDSDMRLHVKLSLPGSLMFEFAFAKEAPVAKYVGLFVNPAATVEEAEVLIQGAAKAPDFYLKAKDLQLPSATTFVMGRDYQDQAPFRFYAESPGASGDVVVGFKDKTSQASASATQDVLLLRDAAGNLGSISIHVTNARMALLCPAVRLSGFTPCGSYGQGALRVQTAMKHTTGVADLRFEDRYGNNPAIRVDVAKGLPDLITVQFSPADADPWQHVTTSAAMNADGSAASPVHLLFASYRDPKGDRSRTEVILRSVPTMLDLRNEEFPGGNGECGVWDMQTSTTRVKSTGHLDVAMLDAIAHDYTFGRHESGWVWGTMKEQELRDYLPAPDGIGGNHPPADARFTRIAYTTYAQIPVTEYSYDWNLEIWARKTGTLQVDDADVSLNKCGALKTETQYLPNDEDHNEKGLRADFKGHLTGTILTTWEMTWTSTSTASVMGDANRAGGTWNAQILMGFADAHPPGARLDDKCPRDGDRAWVKFWTSGWTKLWQPGDEQVCSEGGITMFSYRGGGYGLGMHGAWDVDDPPQDARISNPYEDSVCKGKYQSDGFRGDPTLFGYDFWRGKFTTYDTTHHSCDELKASPASLSGFPRFNEVPSN